MPGEGQFFKRLDAIDRDISALSSALGGVGFGPNGNLATGEGGSPAGASLLMVLGNGADELMRQSQALSDQFAQAVASMASARASEASRARIERRKTPHPTKSLKIDNDIEDANDGETGTPGSGVTFAVMDDDDVRDSQRVRIERRKTPHPTKSLKIDNDTEDANDGETGTPGSGVTFAVMDDDDERDSQRARIERRKTPHPTKSLKIDNDTEDANDGETGTPGSGVTFAVMDDDDERDSQRVRIERRKTPHPTKSLKIDNDPEDVNDGETGTPGSGVTFAVMDDDDERDSQRARIERRKTPHPTKSLKFDDSVEDANDVEEGAPGSGVTFAVMDDDDVRDSQRARIERRKTPHPTKSLKIDNDTEDANDGETGTPGSGVTFAVMDDDDERDSQRVRIERRKTPHPTKSLKIDNDTEDVNDGETGTPGSGVTFAVMDDDDERDSQRVRIERRKTPHPTKSLKFDDSVEDANDGEEGAPGSGVTFAVMDDDDERDSQRARIERRKTPHPTKSLKFDDSVEDAKGGEAEMLASDSADANGKDGACSDEESSDRGVRFAVMDDEAAAAAGRRRPSLERRNTPHPKKLDNLLFDSADTAVAGVGGAGIAEGGQLTSRTQPLGAGVYYTLRVPPARLVEPAFLRSHVLNGDFCLLARDAPLDRGGGFAILPGGLLRLELRAPRPPSASQIMSTLEWLGAVSVSCGVGGGDRDVATAAETAAQGGSTESGEAVGAGCGGGEGDGDGDGDGDGHVLPPELVLRGPVTVTRWQGFVPSSVPAACIARARALVGSGSGGDSSDAGDMARVPWAAVLVWGVPDAPVSWYARAERACHEHGLDALDDGANHYVILVMPGERYCLLSLLGEKDTRV
eukprot:g1813.t1